MKVTIEIPKASMRNLRDALKPRWKGIPTPWQSGNLRKDGRFTIELSEAERLRLYLRPRRAEGSRVVARLLHKAIWDVKRHWCRWCDDGSLNTREHQRAVHPPEPDDLLADVFWKPRRASRRRRSG